MKTDKSSRTAESAAMIRARHLREDRPLVFEDQYAVELTSPRLRRVVKSRFLRWGIKRLLGSLDKWRGQVLVRSRYTEDLLTSAVPHGVQQYVIIGAGFDSFALRRPDLMRSLSVFELDHPATQRTKRARLAQVGVKLPTGIELIPIDFERETIVSALNRVSYDPSKRTFFSWLATVPYLSEEAIFDTLSSIASASSEGSQLVFDFNAPIDYAPPQDRPTLEKLNRYIARRGEPLMASFEPDPFLGQVCGLGFELLESLSPEEQDKRYFANRGDGLRTIPTSFLVHVRRAHLRRGDRTAASEAGAADLITCS